MTQRQTIDTEPYVRTYPVLKLLLWNRMMFNPWMARRLAQRLTAAADRIDPEHKSLPPWKEK